MSEDLEQINQRLQELLGDLQRYTGRQMEEALKGMLDPSLLRRFFKGRDFDASGLAGMMGGQPGFDPYRILGLDKTASDEEVKKRYRQRAHQFHPDTVGPGMEFHFQCTLAAYEMIKKERGWR